MDLTKDRDLLWVAKERLKVAVLAARSPVYNAL